MQSVIIPHFLKAKSPPQLVDLMLEKSIQMQCDVSFFDIQFDGSDWFVWYNEKVDLLGLLAIANKRTEPTKVK